MLVLFLQLVLVLSQLQSAIINILALNGTIACAPPFSAPARGYSEFTINWPFVPVFARKNSVFYLPSRLWCVFVSAVLSQQLLILEMFIITLVTRLLYRRQYDPLPEEEHDDNENTKIAAVEFV